MLALRSTAASSFQMDWSLDPKEDDVKKGSENEDENQSLNPQEPPLRRRPQQRNGQSSNGFHSQPSTELPIVRLRKQDGKMSKSPLSTIAKVKEAEISIKNQTQNGAPSSQEPSPGAKQTSNELPPPTAAPTSQNSLPPQQYDVANISNILKTFQSNRFINSSILRPEVKEEPPGAKELNQQSRHNVENSHPNNCSSLNDDVQIDIKDEAEPALITVKTDVDIEAELPSTSIKQRPAPKKKPARPRKPAVSKAKVLETPKKPTKECAKRTSKRKTNYREDSSSDDAKRTVKSKCPNPVVKTEPSTMPPQSNAKVELKPEIPAMKAEPAKEIDSRLGLAKKPKQVTTVTKNEVAKRTKNEGEGKQQIKKVPILKNKRPRYSAAAARNKNRLNPLTRKEQIMMNKFMESQEPFLQNLPCVKLASRITKCRECRCSSLRSDSVFCRFFDFRRLRYKENATLMVDGFSDPQIDPGSSDVALWMPGPPPRDIDLDVSRFMLMNVADQFCRIWQEEQDAIKENMSTEPTIAWKKVVKGVREICDVCETTLFNFHWTCSKCGFGVCIDCYRDRKRKLTKKVDKPQRGFDDYGWLVCTFRETHEQTTLMLTQIIPGDCLNILASRLHEVCRIWKIPQKCGCPMLKGLKDELLLPKYFEIANKIIKESYLRFYSSECEIKYRDRIKNLDPENLDDHMEIMEAETELMEEAKAAGMLPVVLATTLKHLKLAPSVATLSSKDTMEDVHDVVTVEYNAVRSGTQKAQRYMAQRIMTTKLSRHMYPGIDHDWLCSGKLLRLLDSRNKRNAKLFQDVWRRGQPVMVSELCKFLNISLWHPEAFCRDFGEKKNDLINCMTGNLVPNQPMKHFWEGFQCVSKRLLDAQGQPMLLKLKDWPPGDDFAEILPTRFADLMSALPMPEYTLRSGCLNIASRLPNIFVPPDLGPKMYNAYGSALHPDKGTTNLHLDISDAVNVMVYVGIPTDESAKAQIKAALRAIDGGGCDIVTRRRAREPGVMPGALWHIYSARDADKIRDLLNRVTIERGYRLEPDHDPIHDQNWYLDNELRERLYDEYGVEGFPIVQCLGDAVFIPAGAPHQVRNLHNCIKVAEDFVSPENIQHCYHLSQQFRKLSMSHTNHEDKLQIRNVIYHAIKDTTSYLTYLLSRHM